MPIYEYQCTDCGHIEEVIQKISDPHLTDCPSCEKPAMKKNVTAASFRLSGGGWYETDFKSDNRKNLADDGKESSGGDKKADKPSDGTKKESAGAKSEASGKSADTAAKKSPDSGSSSKPTKDS